MELELVSFSKIEVENRHLNKKVKQLEKEAELIKWLEEIVHINFQLDAEDIINRQGEIEKEFKEYRWRSSEEISSLKIELESVKAERDETLKKMKKQTVQVVKPLIEQVKERQNEINQLKQEKTNELKNIKKLHLVIRSTTLCDLYQRQTRKNFGDKEKAKMD